MSQYQDIFMRDFLGDTGQIPSTLSDVIYFSPDIIPYGPNPVPNYQSFFAGNYNGPLNYYSDINVGAYNYIYTRGFNLFPGPQTGKINLYWARASLLLMPSQWLPNLLPNSNNTTAANVSASQTNQVVVGVGPFYWQPQPITGNDHYCLIAQVVTNQDPDQIPTTIEDFALFVANNPGIAWRNVALVNNPGANYSAFVIIVNPDPTVNMFSLTVTCTNIPDGTGVALLGALSPPAINFQDTVGPANQIGSNPKINTFGWVVFGVPANFQESIQLSATAPTGTQFPLGSSVAFNYFVLVPQASPIAQFGINPKRFAMDSKSRAAAEAGAMVPLGGFTFQFGQIAS